MRCDVGRSVRWTPGREADLDHDRVGRSSRQSLDCVPFPLVAMRIASDHDELTAIQIELGVETALGESTTWVSGTAAWNHSPGSCDRRPAAMPTSDSSSTTSGGRSSRTSPSSCSARCAAIRPESRSTVGGSSRSDAHDASRPIRAAASTNRSSERRPERTASTRASRTPPTGPSNKSWPRQSASAPAAIAARRPPPLPRRADRLHLERIGHDGALEPSSTRRRSGGSLGSSSRASHQASGRRCARS